MNKIKARIILVLRYFLRMFGFEFIYWRVNNENIKKGYNKILTTSLYSPWLIDKEFIELYNKIRKNTLVDILRAYGLWSVVEETKYLDGDIVEIGVWRGGTGALIAGKAKIEGIKDDVNLFDTYAGIVKAGENDNLYSGGELADTSVEYVKHFIYDELKLNNVKILQGVFPEHTGKYLEGKTIRLCHIDVDVYQSAADALNYIWPQICVGGVVIFDDYGTLEFSGITKCVNENKKRKDRRVFYNINGQAIMVKVSN